MAITSIKLILPTYHSKNIAKKRRNVKSKDSFPCTGLVCADGVTIRKQEKLTADEYNLLTQDQG